MIFFTSNLKFTALLLVVVMAGAEVQKEISLECKEFLYMGTPPRGIRDIAFKMICQYYDGKARFFTLYDTFFRIPVYSAYTFKRSDGSRKVDVPWMYEPQLTTDTGSREMEPFPEAGLHQKFSDAQAVLDDYSDTVNYERGQLNPDEHQAHLGDKDATYTLTNVVPQVREFNIGSWKVHEHKIRKRLNNYCRGTAYVVTGVTTSGKMIRRHNMNRVAVPTQMWSAYCCVDYDRNAPVIERSKFPSYASHGLNDKENNEVQEMALQDLENYLKTVTYVDKTFQIFYSNCVPKETQYYN